MRLDWPDDLKRFAQNTRIPIRLACVTQSRWPITLSLWYLYENGLLYCATSGRARVVTYLQREPRCGFEIASDQMPYCGVRGQANARLVSDRGDEILERLLHRYLGGIDNPLSRKLLARDEVEVAIELTPIWLSSWNFTKRMKDSFLEEELVERFCPEGSKKLNLRKQTAIDP